MESTTVGVTINGEQRTVRDGIALVDLLSDMKLNPLLVVVEHNREILQRVRVPDVRVHAGDTLEIVHFVGGG